MSNLPRSEVRGRNESLLHLIIPCYTTAMAAICSSCGQLNLDEARLCSACGHVIASQVASVASPSPIVFVGRQRELQALQAHLDAAFAGAGSLAMLIGEAGIGKTSTAGAFASFARERGLVVLWGSCYEGEWSPPYGPWVEALGEYARTCPSERLQRELGSGAPPLVQLIPQMRALLPDAPLPTPLPPDEERLRLYEAVAQFLLVIAQEQPVVLVLDDLHWADSDSLRLLRYVARFVSRSRLVLVGTYRDPAVELHRQPFLSEVLAVLRRETDYERIPIRGLTEEEVAAYLDQAGQQPLPQALVRAIYAETNGNPLYAREVFRHLIEEEKIISRGGRWSTDLSVSDLGIPEGVRQILDRRVSRLSQETQLLLRCASALTGGFTFQVIEALTGLPEETLLDSLDEALQA